MLRLFSLLSFLLLISTTTKSYADFVPYDPNCPIRAGCYSLSGEITNRDVLAVHAMIQNLQTRKINSNPLVKLNSSGGDIDAAIEIGRSLRKTGAVATIGKSDVCFSACVFVLAGAPQRAIFGSVGIHRPYSLRTGDISIEDAQRDYTRLMHLSKSYLIEMNLPDALYEAMIRTPPEELRVLDEYELANFGLNSIDPVQQEVSDSFDAKQYGLTKQEYFHRKVLSKQICDSVLQTGDGNGWNQCNERVMRTAQ